VGAMEHILLSLNERDTAIGVVGLGFVGLPLATLFAEKVFKVIGYDTDIKKIMSLKEGKDPTGQVEKIPSDMSFVNDPSDLSKCSVIFVCVPTPTIINSSGEHEVDLQYIEKASTIIHRNLSKDTIVCFESSVYPGLTNSVIEKFFLKPKLDNGRRLEYGVDYFVGFSPERINPGDKVNTLDKISKLVSGDCPATAETLASLYRSVLNANVHVCSSIRVAELAKLHENIQRAILIAHANELAKYCSEKGIRTSDVLDACKTKWNFVGVNPGIVQGHCLPENPHYLLHTEEVEELSLVRTAKKVNEDLPLWIALKLHNLLQVEERGTADIKIAICGVAYKENVGDSRNSGAESVKKQLEYFGYKNISLIDRHINGMENLEDLEVGSLHAVIIVTSHDEYKEASFTNLVLSKLNFKENNKPIIFDLKGCLDQSRLYGVNISPFTYYKL